MATVPTSNMERELRSLYLQWVRDMPADTALLPAYIDQFHKSSTKLINARGGQIARLGVSAGFPAPKELDLDKAIGNVLSSMKEAALRAGIATGVNATDISRAMLKAGFEGSYHELERLARTEVVQAYWSNQWAEADDLGLVMLWGAEDGPRTCPFCLSKEGLLIEDDQIRDHPNGRCTLIPTLPNKVPVRSKSTKPNFLKRDWDGTVPQQLDQVLGRGMQHALVGSRFAQQSIGGMVSQGWTSQEAGHHLLNGLGIAKATLQRSGWSQTLRALESHADELWAGLSKGVAPRVLYRGGIPEVNTGLTSWTSDVNVAGLYAIRNKGQVYRMDVPADLYALDLTAPNPQQQEYLVLGTMRLARTKGTTTVGNVPVISGSLDGPTPYLQAPT